MGDKTSTIVFLAVPGLFKRGPYLCGTKYTVPDDVADHLVAAGAQRVTLAANEQAAPLGPEHHEHFDVTRVLVAANAARVSEKAAGEKISAPAEPAATAAAKSN